MQCSMLGTQPASDRLLQLPLLPAFVDCCIGPRGMLPAEARGARLPVCAGVHTHGRHCSLLLSSEGRHILASP